MKRLVILGAGGRLGAAVARTMASKYEVIGFTHHQLDLGSSLAINETLGPARFDALINCAALTNVDYCETHEEEANRVNGMAVGELAALCAEKNARFIHIGTDYVFDGEKPEPYTEEDPVHPISIYGASKRLGELNLLQANPHALCVRVSWVFGPDRPSFLDAILKRALESDQVAAIGDKFSCPTSALDLAQWLAPLLTNPEAKGILHLCNSGGCTWRDYGEFGIRCALQLGVPMKTDHVASLKLAEMQNFVAKRPVQTIMRTEKFTRLTGIVPRPWQESVAEYVTQHCDWLKW